MSDGPQCPMDLNVWGTPTSEGPQNTKRPQCPRDPNVQGSLMWGTPMAQHSRKPNVSGTLNVRGTTLSKGPHHPRDHYFPGTPTSKGPKLQYATSKGPQCSSEPNVWETPTPKGPQHPRDPNIWRTSKFKEIQPLSNQIYLVTLRPTQFDTSFIFTKKSNVAKCIFDISNAEMAQWCRKSWNLDIQSQFSLSKNVQIFLKKYHWIILI